MEKGYSVVVQSYADWLKVAITGRSPRRNLSRVICLAAHVLVLFGLLFRPFVVRGRSMEPTLRNGAWRIASRWWVESQRQPVRGDVVIIRRVGGKVFYLKRILGLPGETIQFNAGQLLVNGRPIEEGYRSGPSDWSMPAVRLGSDEYFVAGDNRRMQLADHAAGKVERRRLAGKLWP